MEKYGGTKTKTVRGGKKQRVLWPQYSPEETSILRNKMLNGWDDLGYLNDFWNNIHDECDLAQYRRMAKVWQLRETGQTFKQIGNTLGIDPGKAGGFVTGYNRRPNLALMYLNHAKLGTPPEGWKWILDCTPKPINPYPKALQVPESIRDYNDILEFLKQFPPIRQESEALKFFGLTSEWAEQHKAELFWFLAAFLIGDGGKQYVHNEYRARHYKKTAMTTRMTYKDSNFRVLRYVQLALESVDISSHQIKSEDGVVRWNSEASNAITWMMQVCIGLNEGECTSNNPIVMPWLLHCPRNLIVAFLQGLADSDGNVEKHGYYADISSVPNSEFYKQLFDSIGIKSRLHPKHQPQQTRLLIQNAIKLPLFNPIIQSYRHEQLIQHAIRRKLIPPPPSFFSNG